MNKPVLDPVYWKGRLEDVHRNGKPLYHSVYRCHQDIWDMIEARHRQFLGKVVKPEWSILDVGCGYGRLLTLLPDHWQGEYVGIDVSPDMVRLATKKNPHRVFLLGDVRDLKVGEGFFDLAVMVSFRPMITDNVGLDYWCEVEGVIHRVARNLLYMEVDLEQELSLVRSRYDGDRDDQ